MTHICISKVTIIVSDNGLSPGRRQAIIWNNAGILLIGPLGTNFSGILIQIHAFSFKKIRLKMSSAKCCSFLLGLNVLTLDMLNFLKGYKWYIHIWIISWIWLQPGRWNWLWDNNIYCLSYSANAMPADALVTSGASASASIVLTPKASLFCLHHQKS